MNPFKTALAASSALIASTSLSFATVVTQTAQYSSNTNWGTSSSTTGFTPTKTLSFAGFNNSLGSLTGVTVTIDESVAGSVNLKNNGTSSTSVSGNLANTLKFILPNLSAKTLSANSNSYTDTLASGAASGPQTISGNASTTHSFLSNLASFESAWDITLGDLGGVTTSATNGDGSATYSDIGSVTFKVNYTYTPTVTTPPTNTPEPATMAVLGTGLAGLGLLRRRNKAL